MEIYWRPPNIPNVNIEPDQTVEWNNVFDLDRTKTACNKFPVEPPIRQGKPLICICRWGWSGARPKRRLWLHGTCPHLCWLVHYLNRNNVHLEGILEWWTLFIAGEGDRIISARYAGANKMPTTLDNRDHDQRNGDTYPTTNTQRMHWQWDKAHKTASHKLTMNNCKSGLALRCSRVSLTSQHDPNTLHADITWSHRSTTWITSVWFAAAEKSGQPTLFAEGEKMTRVWPDLKLGRPQKLRHNLHTEASLFTSYRQNTYINEPGHHECILIFNWDSAGRETAFWLTQLCPFGTPQTPNNKFKWNRNVSCAFNQKFPWEKCTLGKSMTQPPFSPPEYIPLPPRRH